MNIYAGVNRDYLIHPQQHNIKKAVSIQAAVDLTLSYEAKRCHLFQCGYSYIG